MNTLIKPSATGKVKIEGGFKEGMGSLPMRFEAEAREYICSRCWWVPSTWSQKMRGVQPFRMHEVGIVEEYFKTKNINAWTGESLS